MCNWKGCCLCQVWGKPLCVKNDSIINIADILTLGAAGANLEKLTGAQEGCQRWETSPGVELRGAQMWSCRNNVGMEECPSRTLLGLAVCTTLRRCKRWSSKVIENTQG